VAERQGRQALDVRRRSDGNVIATRW
jgi:hypothetical protein